MQDLTASSGPTTGHSTISQTGGASGIMCSRKGRKYWTGRGGEKKGEKQQGSTTRMEEKVLQVPEQLPQPSERPFQSRFP